MVFLLHGGLPLGPGQPHGPQELREHLVCDDERLNDFYNFSDVYFGATYIDPDRDKGVKRRLNHSLQKGPAGQGAFIQNKPKKNQVAVFSSLWFPGHSVYRTLAEYVDALRPDYELTYVHLGGLRNNINIGPYTKIKYMSGAKTAWSTSTPSARTTSPWCLIPTSA